MVSTRGQSSLPGAQDAPATSTKASRASATTTAGDQGRKKATEKKKSVDAVVPSQSPPSSPSRRQRGAASNAAAAAQEQGHSPKASPRTKASPPRKKRSGQPSKSTSSKKSAADVADAIVDSPSSEDEEENDDGLACLAQGMLDALCGLPGGSKRQEALGDEDGDEEDDDGDDDDGSLRPTTPTDAASPSSDSDDSDDSDSESDDDDGEPGNRASAAPKSISWAPRSLLLPPPATTAARPTSAVSLLARESLVSATPERVAERRSLERARASATRDWFDLPSQALTPELKTDLRLLKLRGALDPTRHYKSADSTKLPSRFHVGTVVESATDFYSSRLSRGERGRSLADELLRDEALSAQRKRRFGALQEEAQARGWKGGGGKGAKARKTTMPRLKKHRVRPKH